MTARKTSEGEPREEPQVAELFPPQGSWTERDYFALPESNRFLELSDGELVMPPHPTYTHQAIVLELAGRLRAFVKEHQPGEVCLAPLPVRLWPGKVREPDLFFISSEHSDRIGEQFCGLPDYVVEVISPGTKQVDRGEKFYEYAKAGVKEYWLVDPEGRSIEVYLLETGAYELTDKFRSREMARSTVLSGFYVPVDEVFGS